MFVANAGARSSAASSGRAASSAGEPSSARMNVWYVLKIGSSSLAERQRCVTTGGKS